MEENIEITDDIKVQLRERQTELVKIVQAFASLENSEEWTTLKELVFSKSLVAIEREIRNQALATPIDSNKLYRLQGEWAWAKQYNEPTIFIENLKKQLEDIKNKLK